MRPELPNQFGDYPSTRTRSCIELKGGLFEILSIKPTTMACILSVRATNIMPQGAYLGNPGSWLQKFLGVSALRF
jgi:hypothetical protein